MKKLVLALVITILSISLFACGKPAIERKENKESGLVLYIDHRSAGGQTIYYDVKADGRLDGYINTKENAGKIKIEIVSISGIAGYPIFGENEEWEYPVDSDYAKILQNSYEKVKSAYKDGAGLPENSTKVDDWNVDLFKKWVAEYIRQDNQGLRENHRMHLAFRAVKMSYDNLNWKERALIWTKPEETVLKIGFMKFKGQGEVRPLYLRPVFEEDLKSLYQKERFNGLEIEKQYRLECKKQGLQIPGNMYKDAFYDPY